MPPNNQKTRRSPKKAPRVTNNDDKPYTVQQLLEAADQAVQVSDPVQALDLYTAAQAKADTLPAQLDILEKRAAVKVSLGDQDGALSDYQTAVERIESSSSKPSEVLERQAGLYMYMGQLHQGVEALEAYQKAINLLQHVFESTKAAATKRELATALCSSAELYLTDLCFEDNAEQECERLVLQAMNLKDETTGAVVIDAWQTGASLRFSQQRGVEAVEWMLKAFDAMRTGCEALSSLVGLRENESNSTGGQQEQAKELIETEAVQNLPGFEFRCQSAKLLLECAASIQESSNDEKRHEQCIQAAMDVLGSLLAENDEVVEIWALAGDACRAKDPQSAAHYWNRALEMLKSVRKSLTERLQVVADDDEEEELNQELEDANCEIEALEKKLGELDTDVAMEESES